MVVASDGEEVLFDRFDKVLELFRAAFENGGTGFYQTGEEEWTVQI